METSFTKRTLSNNRSQQWVSDDWAKLIRKFRWIGMDKEAEGLENSMRNLPLEITRLSPDAALVVSRNSVLEA